MLHTSEEARSECKWNVLFVSLTCISRSADQLRWSRSASKGPLFRQAVGLPAGSSPHWLRVQQRYLVHYLVFHL